jgi:hypothetical protein
LFWTRDIFEAQAQSGVIDVRLGIPQEDIIEIPQENVIQTLDVPEVRCLM